MQHSLPPCSNQNSLKSENLQSIYRTLSCNDLRKENIGQTVRLSGWLHRKRHHGGLLFLDLRDQEGMTQCVVDRESHPEDFKSWENLSAESVLCIQGVVQARPAETIHASLATGMVEIQVQNIEILSKAQVLPFSLHHDENVSEDLRLQYRFLDLRRPLMHQRMVLRSQVIQELRQQMLQQGFLEIQTPILSAPSPEGARDYVVPSRLHPGEFYALPQAPQQFKQLLMASGFDRYFQIAPCFRDEASRADRSPGEFYQLDMEMAFVEQKDVWRAIEPVLWEVFKKFAPPESVITSPPFPELSYEESMLWFSSDKPDLRNPLFFQDIGKNFAPGPLKNLVQEGACIRGLILPACQILTKKWMKDLGQWALDQGQNLGMIQKIAPLESLPPEAPAIQDLLQNQTPWCRHELFGRLGNKHCPCPEASSSKAERISPEMFYGPLVKFCQPEDLRYLDENLQEGQCLVLVCGLETSIRPFLTQLRTHLGQALNFIGEKDFSFCWIKDFPMYEWDEESQSIVFSHNPFSMPQGGIQALMHQDPLTIKAFQYDIVCNGIELSSGAIRNHIPEWMYKAFSIAGYRQQEVDERFGAMIRAFQYGTPPHGGCAPGIDRMVMLLSGTPNIREIIPFPLNQNARDPLMNAPRSLPCSRLKELHLKISDAKKDLRS